MAVAATTIAPLHRVTALTALAFAAVLLSGCAATGPGAVTAWVAGEREQVLADSPPVLESAIYSAARGSVELDAAINETVALQLAVRATHGLAGPFQVSLTDFKSNDATLPVADVARLYRARFVAIQRYRAWYPTHAERTPTPAEFPDILIPWEAPRGGGPLRVNGTKNELVWIDISVPPGTQPGDYTARLELRSDGDQPAAFATDVVLRVAPLTLPDSPSLPVVCRVNPIALLGEQLRWPQGQPESSRLLPDEASHQGAVTFVNGVMAAFHEHRLNPVAAASFPKYRLAEEGRVEMEWDAYDRLVGAWLEGSAFADSRPVPMWMLPVSASYPDADQHGGFDSPRYARVLSAYLRECQAHFVERGWTARTFVRLLPPGPLTPRELQRLGRVAGIMREGGVDLPLVAHVPAASLRGLGWFNAPEPRLDAAGVLAPPAAWFEPDAMRSRRAAQQHTWFVPDDPPYSGSLAIEAPSVDATALAWQAYRYGAQGIWIENAAAPPPDDGHGGERAGAGLVYAGAPFGMTDRPAASIRLKRLRRGVQDYELLRMLEQAGMPALGRATAEQLIRWAFTDACGENLLDCPESGWSVDPAIFARARDLIAQEVANSLVNDPEGRTRQAANQADWARIMNQATRVRAEVDGVRLAQTDAGFEARAFVSLSNGSTRTASATWTLPDPPLGWTLSEAIAVNAPAGARRTAALPLSLESISYNADGAYPFKLAAETADAGALEVVARLAAAACPIVETAPKIDGDLSDWPLAASNAAGDFRLCRGARSAATEDATEHPAAATRAFIGMDDSQLYIAIRCALLSGDKPIWSAENTIPIDGAIPWSQDVVEVLLNPRNTLQGSPDDLFILQVKPNGLLIARQGPLTDPPISAARDWTSGARVAVKVYNDAWTVELALPLEALGPPAAENRVWGFNVTRLDAKRGEYSSWSGARGNCYSPTSMGNLVLQRP